MSSEEDMPPVPPLNTTMVITSNTVYIQRPDTFLDRHSKVFDNGSKVYLTQNVSLSARDSYIEQSSLSSVSWAMYGEHFNFDRFNCVTDGQTDER